MHHFDGTRTQIQFTLHYCPYLDGARPRLMWQNRSHVCSHGENCTTHHLVLDNSPKSRLSRTKHCTTHVLLVAGNSPNQLTQPPPGHQTKNPKNRSPSPIPRMTGSNENAKLSQRQQPPPKEPPKEEPQEQ